MHCHVSGIITTGGADCLRRYVKTFLVFSDNCQVFGDCDLSYDPNTCHRRRWLERREEDEEAVRVSSALCTMCSIPVNCFFFIRDPQLTSTHGFRQHKAHIHLTNTQLSIQLLSRPSFSASPWPTMRRLSPCFLAVLLAIIHYPHNLRIKSRIWNLPVGAHTAPGETDMKK